MRIPGGIKQKIGFARAIYDDPKLIVLDEPTSNMDSSSEKKFIESIKKLKSKKSTIVVITHSKEIFRVSDYILTLENGEQRTYDSIKNIFNKIKAQQEKKSILEKQKQTFLTQKKNNDS